MRCRCFPEVAVRRGSPISSLEVAFAAIVAVVFGLFFWWVAEVASIELLFAMIACLVFYFGVVLFLALDNFWRRDAF